MAGAVAVVDATRGGPWVRDVTGLLLLPTAVALLAVGAGVLWASRRRGRSVWWRLGRRALLAIAALFVAYWVVLPVSFAIVATERPRDAVKVVDLGRPGQAVSLRARDGLRLAAWYVPSRNGAAVVLFPKGWTTGQARMLVRHDYGVLMVDPRGYGGSEGDPNAYGWGAVRDIDAAVAWLQTRPEVSKGRIGGLGLSVGGEQMIEAAAGNEGLRAIVSEGAGLRSVRESLAKVGPSALELALQYPADLVQTAAVWVLSGEWPPPALPEAAARISPRAAFFIWGEEGQEVEAALNVPSYQAAGQPKEQWEVPGAGHTGGLGAQPREYERRVVGFFDRELLGHP